MSKRILIIVICTLLSCPIVFSEDAERYAYSILSTTRTSTMEKEMNEAGNGGYRFGGVMGGETAYGGKEVVVAMIKPQGQTEAHYEYKLLATNKTSTMQKEMQQAGDAGFEYKGQTVFESLLAGKEVVVILERDTARKPGRYEYKLLATSKTSTMQKEMQEAGDAGFDFVGLTVASTSFGGNEVITILRKKIGE